MCLNRPIDRLKKRPQFLAVAAGKRRYATQTVAVQVLEMPHDTIQVGFVTTKKLGNAVVRNRARRRLREAVRLVLNRAPFSTVKGYDVVVIGRFGTCSAPWPKLCQDLSYALRRVSFGKK